MTNTSRNLLLAAAVSGLLSGAALQKGRAETTNAAPGQASVNPKMPHVQGCAGQNDCKGLGGCKTDSHACKFKNSCKGQGGCEISQKDVDHWHKDHPAPSATAQTNSVPPQATGQ